MKTKLAKTVSLLLIVTMLMGLAIIETPTVAAAPAWTKVRVLPNPIPLGVGHVDVIGDTFMFAVVIENVTNLYGFGIKIYINTTYFEYVSHVATIPWNTSKVPVPPSPYAGILYSPITEVKNEYDPVASILEVAFSSKAPAPSFNGTGTVCVVTLRVIAQPYDYEIAPADYLSVWITFAEIKLAGYGLPPPAIPYDAFDGEVQLWSRTFVYPAIPVLKVLGATANVDIKGKGVCNTFTADAWLTIDSFWDVAGFDMNMTFDPTLIEATNVLIDPDHDFGSFWTSGTHIILNETHNDKGYVRVAFVGVGTHTPVLGTLKLFTVTFHEIYEATKPTDIKSCFIKLENTPPRPEVDLGGTLYSCPIDMAGFPRPDRPMSPWNGSIYSVPIPHTSEPATYTCAYKPLGRAIDVYTQYGPGFDGKGPNENSSMYWPQKEVILYANVTYNMWPEQQKDVAFEIIDPYGDTYAVLCNRTDAGGIASVSFRLPWKCDDPTYYFGLWEVIATVDVACEHVNDTLHFKYDYKVNIWKVTTDKTDYVHGEDIVVTIEYGSNAQIEYAIVFYVTGLDETGVPFDIGFDEVIVGGAIWCTYADGKTTVTITIPKWARAGVATIQVNALDALPRDGGVQEFPLYWVTVNILAA